MTVLQRVLFVVLILFVVWRILASWGKKLGQKSPGADSYSRFSPNQRRQRQAWARGETGSGPERLVACSLCGTYVPSRRALTSASGDRFCGPDCRDSAASPSTDDD